MKSSFTSFLITLTAIFLPVSSMAHGYWIETSGSHKAKEAVFLKLFYGDYSVGERLSGKTLDKMKDIKITVSGPGGQQETVLMTQHNDYWEGSFTPQAEGIYLVTGINDIREVQDWTKHNLGIVRPIQYLKTTYTVGDKKDQQNSNLFIDINDAEDEVLVTKGGEPLSAQKVVVSTFNSGEDELMTDGNGKARLNIEKAGIYILSVDWIDTTPGSFNGKPYQTVRHRMDYSFYKN